MSFSYQFLLLVFHWSLSDSKSSQISQTLLNTLAGHYSVEVMMISIFPLNPSSRCPFSRLMGTVLWVPTTIVFTVTFTFHCFFLVLWPVEVFSSLFVFFYFHSVVRLNDKFLNNSLIRFFLDCAAKILRWSKISPKVHFYFNKIQVWGR